MGSEEEEVKLLMSAGSVHSMSCSLALLEKGVKFEAVEVILSGTSDVERLNPVFKQVPVLIHRGRAISDFQVILDYIEEAWPPSDTTPALLPASAYDRSVARFWANFASNKFIQSGLDLIGSDGEEHMNARLVTVGYFKIMEKGMRTIGSNGPFFLGDKLTLADVALAPFVAWLPSFETFGKIKFAGPEQCGHMHKWLAAMRGHPNVVACSPPSEWLLKVCTELRPLGVEKYKERALLQSNLYRKMKELCELDCNINIAELINSTNLE